MGGILNAYLGDKIMILMGLGGKTSTRKHLAQSFSFSSIVSTKPALTNHHFHCIWFRILNIQNLAQLHIEKKYGENLF